MIQHTVGALLPFGEAIMNYKCTLSSHPLPVGRTHHHLQFTSHMDTMKSLTEENLPCCYKGNNILQASLLQKCFKGTCT